MLASLLPAEVVVVGVHDGDRVGPLHAAERDAFAGAVDGRRQEVTRSRHCARTALARLGAPGGPLLPGPAREPRWPAGVRGAITHGAGYCAAAVAWARDVPVLGIDAEANEALPDGVLDLVTVPDERAWLADARDGDAAHPEPVAWDRLVFSAKESVYKAWYPLTGRWLGFEDARVTVDRAARTFIAELLSPAAFDSPRPDGASPDGAGAGSVLLTGFEGRYAVSGRLLLTAVHTGLFDE